MGRRAALYARVSTADQSCERQERDLRAFAERSDYEIVGVFRETASGARNDRAERRRVMALAQAREIDVILVTELSRWGRSTIDLLHTLRDLEAHRVSLSSLKRSKARADVMVSGRKIGACMKVLTSNPCPRNNASKIYLVSTEPSRLSKPSSHTG